MYSSTRSYKKCIRSPDNDHDANGRQSTKKALTAARLAGSRNVSIANTDETERKHQKMVMPLIGGRVALREELALGDDRRNHARLQLLARQVVILQVAVFVAEGLALVQRAGEHVGHVGLRVQRVARVVPAVAALVARLQLVGLHDLRGVVRQILAVLRVGRYAGLLLNALVDDGAGLPIGVISAVRHDRREIEVDVVGSRIASAPAHLRDSVEYVVVYNIII